MIFVSVGTQLPFRRLTGYMDDLARELDEEVIAQTGVDVQAQTMRTFATCTLAEMEHYTSAARVIVAHAGVGTVLSARRAGTPLILVPRRAALGEHRNDHQVGTAEALEGRQGVRVAWHQAEIAGFLSEKIEHPDGAPGPRYAGLLDTLRDFAAA